MRLNSFVVALSEWYEAVISYSGGEMCRAGGNCFAATESKQHMKAIIIKVLVCLATVKLNVLCNDTISTSVFLY